jgi:polar amino acid transport system ATP-binding protein
MKKHSSALQSIPVVSIQNISAHYVWNKPVLRNVSLDIMAGEKIVLLGMSGSGKSTLLNCIVGTKIPNQGKIFFNGEPLRYRDADLRQHRRRVPMIDQDATSLIEFHTLRNNLIKAMLPSGIPRWTADGYARRLLQEVGLSGKENAYPHTLSGGERQRAVISKAWAIGGNMEGNLLLADEPVSALDPPTARKILDLLERLQCAALLVTHHPDRVIDWCDRMLLLDHRRHCLVDITNVKEKRPDMLGSFKNYSELAEASEQLRQLGKKRHAATFDRVPYKHVVPVRDLSSTEVKDVAAFGVASPNPVEKTYQIRQEKEVPKIPIHASEVPVRTFGVSAQASDMPDSHWEKIAEQRRDSSQSIQSTATQKHNVAQQANKPTYGLQRAIQ